MNVNIQTVIEVDTSDLAMACSAEELGNIFCKIANHFADSPNEDFRKRRSVVMDISDNLSEAAKRMLGEVLAVQLAKNAQWCDVGPTV